MRTLTTLAMLAACSAAPCLAQRQVQTFGPAP